MGTVQIDGSTPKLTIGNATAEDALIVFDGNAQDFYIGLDDSADDLVIGLGSAAGTTPAISINEDRDVTISDGAIDFDVASHDTSNGLKLGGTLVTATAAELNIMDGVTSTAAEINLIDGGTARGTTALADGDGILINDAGTMRMTNVTAVKTYMSGSNAVTALNNATANELVTVGSTTTELDAETNLTFAANVLAMIRTDDANSILRMSANRGAGGDALGSVEYQWNGTPVAKIVATAGADTTNKDDANLDFFVTASGASITRAMTIGKDGVIGMGAANVADLGKALHIRSADSGAGTPNVDADELVIENSGAAGLTIYSGTSSAGRIMFGDSGNVANGFMSYDHSDNHIEFGTSDTEHFRIASDGTLTATDTSIGSNSDSRIKENISDFTYDLAKFKQLQPRTFDWKNPSQHNGASGNRGFVAQEVQAIDDYWIGELKLTNNHDDYSLLDSVTKNNCVIDNERIIASGISESDWETGKLNDTYPKDSTWKASAEGDRVSLTSKLGKKDAMYISIIQQLITRIEALEG